MCFNYALTAPPKLFEIALLRFFLGVQPCMMGGATSLCVIVCDVVCCVYM